MSDSVYGLENIIRGLCAENEQLVSNIDKSQEEHERLRAENERLTKERDALRAALDSAKMAKTRLDDFADKANAGQVHYSARELKRKIGAAFAEFDGALEQPNPLAYVPITGAGVDVHERRKERGTLEDHEPHADEQTEPTEK